MQRVASGQITFDAAPKPRENDLPLGEVCLVFVQDADGNLIAQGHGVVSIGFTDKDGLTIRQQKITV